MTAKAPGQHAIGGYAVDRVDDGEKVTWEVLHPETGLVATVDTLPDARRWVRENPLPRAPKPPKAKPVPYRALRTAGLVCRARKRDQTFCTSTTVQGSLFCGRHNPKTEKARP